MPVVLKTQLSKFNIALKTNIYTFFKINMFLFIYTSTIFYSFILLKILLQKNMIAIKLVYLIPYIIDNETSDLYSFENCLRLHVVFVGHKTVNVRIFHKLSINTLQNS